ncbi:transcriptional regulator [Pantoea sp. 1.19]|uniref:transcriptional regulator n=1 Tax=Pantoea sp. 1.19 TaxID=1925589 RepID=UPI000948DD13|nr:winged helix-turn-helix domain-containing protein [Pantoea sp. 1.19]
MQEHYLINGKIEFYPVANMLNPHAHPDDKIILNSPASRCFLLLIQRHGTVVSQHDFMEEVWKKNGVMVSPNTFYQNISILRKGLKEAGLEEEIIMTIPRIGLTLSESCSIQQVNDESNAPNPGPTATSDTAPRVDDPADSRAKRAASRLHPSDAFTDSQPQTAQKKRKVTRIVCFSLLMAILLIAVVSVQYYTTPNDLQQYIPFSQEKTCKIFLSPNQTDKTLQSRSLDFANNFTQACHEYPWIYVDAFPQLAEVSVLRCSTQAGIKGICITDYFKEEE